VPGSSRPFLSQFQLIFRANLRGTERALSRGMSDSTRRRAALRPELMQLYRQFQSEQWGLDDGSVNWNAEPIIEDLVLFREPARELRAMYMADCHAGEAFTLRRAGSRLDALEETDAKLCYAMMITDEHRHTQAFVRYREKLDRLRAPDPRLVEMLEWLDTLEVEAFVLVALVLETSAIHALPYVWRSTRDPLIRAFLPKIHRDELRHEAFCQLYLQARESEWTPARRAQLASLAREGFVLQERCLREPNPLLTFEVPLPMQAGIELASRLALTGGANALVKRLTLLQLPIPPEMARWA
jgi:hypothetical protein